MSRKTGLLAVLILALTALLVPSAASAAGEPNISLELRAPETALLGSKQKVTLHAANPAGQKRGYNLTFRDVLPKGVNYVAGSSSGEPPRIIANAPATGETTLIFENVADLSGNSEYNLSYEVEPEPSAYTIGGAKGEFVNKAEAFVTRKPRNKPRFNAKGEIEAESFTGSAKAEVKTKLSAIEILKSEPSPEGEIMRGLHRQQTVYTLTVKNNQLKPTKEIVVEDYLPAGLEYLACDEADNTTNSSTNPGSAEEYAGSGAINAPGNIPTTTNCLKPSLVETEEVDPPGPKPLGIYTHVTWSGVGELAAGAERKIQYIAAIPIRRNSLTFEGGKPTAASVKQAANLNNNSGPETVDEEALTNISKAAGVFVGGPKAEEQIPVSDTDEITRTAEDLAVQKSVDKATISEGQISTWKLLIESSEYRFVNNVRIDDVLPNGLCPLGAVNYEKPIQLLAECNPTGNEPSAEYTNVEEQANGTFKIHWDQSTFAALAQIPPSSSVELTFPTRTRIDYQQNFENAKPVLTADSWTNVVDIAGADFARCAPNDPTCTKGQPKIFTQEAEGTDDSDHSEAGQQAGGVTIDKTVRDNLTEVVPADCSGTYVQGTAATKIPDYRPGDRICWQLRVNFAADLFSGTPAVTDFLPPNEKYIVGSAKATGNNTVESTFDESEAEGGSLEWTLGESVASGNKVFEWRFVTEMLKPLTSAPEEITGNLMKFTYSNTEGKTFPLRDRAEIERNEPKLKLTKGVYSVGGLPVGGNGENVNASGAKGGELVKYRLDLKNEGNLEAKAVEIWDRLPSGITCESVKTGSISDGGTCATGTSIVKWTGLTVAEKATRASLTYELTLPSNVAPAQTWTNEAGVRQYQSETNKGAGEPFHYYPTSSIDPTFEAEHTSNVTGTNLKDTAIVSTAAAALAKTRTTTVEQAGNNLASEATIGEGVKYTLTATIPSGSVVFGSPTITDPLGTRLVLVPGTVKGTVNGVAIPTGGFTVEEKEEEGIRNPILRFPATYENAAGSGDDTIKLEFEAKVADVSANNRLAGGTLTNEGKLIYKDQKSATVTKPATVSTAVVEPVIAVAKAHTGGKTVKPGQLVEYTVTATNGTGTRVSTANNSTVVDTVPAGMTPVNGETPVANEGTVNPDGGKWNAEARTITWTVAELAPGASKALHYSLLVDKPANAGSSFKNSVVHTTTSLPGTVAGERSAASSSHVGYEASAEDEATLIEATLAKEVSAPKGRTIGDPLTYTLRLKLPPQIAFYDTTVEDHLPKGVAYDGTSSIKCAPGCEAVAAGATTLTPKTEEGSPLLGWYFGQVAPGEVERTITIVYKAHIAQELEPGVKIQDKNVLTNHAIGLYNGSAKNPVPTEPPPRSSFTNKTEEPTTATEVQEPKLTIKKSVAGATANPKTQPGDALTYTIEVKNTGDSAAYDTVVEDTNPGSLLASVDPSTGEGHEFLSPEAGKPLRWVIPGPLAAGATQKLSYKAALKSSENLHKGDLIPNAANIPKYFGAPEAQRKEEGVGRFREYTENPQSSVTLQVALPEATLAKTAGESGAEEATAEIGQPFNWRLVTKNASTVATLKGVDLRDTLPKGWEYEKGTAEFVPGGKIAPVSEALNGSGEQELVWENVADLAPLGTVTLNFKAIPTTALIGQAGVFTNKAVASGEDLSGSPKSAEGPYAAEDTAKAKLITPPLTIVKKPDAGEAGAKAVAGKSSAYTIEIVNSGEATATAVKVSDLLDLGNDYTAGTASAEPKTGFSETSPPESVETEAGLTKTRLHWEIASIPAKGKVTITVPVSLSPSLPDGTVLHDVATVASKQQPTPASDEGTLEVKREADIALEKTQSAATPNAGEAENYTLKATNLGPSDATGVTITDILPTNVKRTGTLPSGCTEAEGKVTCVVGNLAFGASAEFEIQTQILSGATGTVSNKAKVSSTTKDPKPGNDEASTTATLGTKADLSIVKTGPTAPVLLGSTFTYTLEVTNAGPSDAQAVVVHDALPSEVEGLKAETDTGECTEPVTVTVDCKIGTLVPGGKATVHVTVKAIGIPAGGVPVTNVAEATSTTPDPTPTNKGEAEVTVLPAADLAVTKTAPATVPAGGEVTYDLHLVNNGPSDATGVHLTDPLPEGTQFVAASEGCALGGSTVDCKVGELKVGETRDYQVTVKVPLALAGKPVTNTATVKGEQADPETKNDQSTVTTTAGPAADLSITKTMGAAQAGAPLTYTLAVSNRGPSTASAVTVKDALPAGTTFKSATAGQGGCTAAGQAVTCSLGALASGASTQVTITVDVAVTATGTLKNTATVEGPEPDPNPADNTSTVEGPVTPPAPTAPNLRVTKTADNSSPRVGEPFHYTVTITNRGDAMANNVRVVDTMNGPVKILAVAPDLGSCKVAGAGQVTCLMPKLGPGKTAHVVVTVEAEREGGLRNTVSAEAGNGELTPADNRAVKNVKVQAPRAASYSLTKTADKASVRGGHTVTFSIRLHAGPTALTDLTVCDRLPKSLVFVKAPGASFVSGEACWTRDFLAAGKTLKLRLVARAVRGFQPLRAVNVATAEAGDGPARTAQASVRIKPAFGGKPGGVTG